jgi:hypothetical protein
MNFLPVRYLNKSGQFPGTFGQRFRSGSGHTVRWIFDPQENGGTDSECRRWRVGVG